MKSLHSSNICCSLSKENTYVPTIGAQYLRVNTFLTKGSSSPCVLTILAIWIIGSKLANGNLPFSAEHSISKLSILNGAILEYSPSLGKHSNLLKSCISISIYAVVMYCCLDLTI